MIDNHEKTHIKTNSNTDSTGFSFNSFDKSLIEDLIKCDICNIIFDLSTHAPLMLKCGHTFCKRCISNRTNNTEKNINKMCPIDKKKNVMSLDLSIPNLKLESIVKKLSNLTLSNTKRHLVYSKPAKKSISPIESRHSNNAINNNYVNNAHNNVNVNINNVKNNDGNNINNVNIINKGKEPNIQISTIKSKVNVIINKKNQSNKTNNINLVNTIKNKITSITNASNVNANVNNLNNAKLNNDINKLNNVNKIPSNGQMQTISSGLNELNDNLNTPQIGEEVNIEDENFNKGMNNETFDTIPFCEEKIGDTSFGGDINELLLKSMAQKKIFINEETLNEELNSSLKELNLMGNQDSLNISLTNSKEENNNVNIFKINKANLLDQQNTHQIRTIYDKIKLKLKNSEEQKEKNNNNIINNISNSIIIINDDNINIITDNSSSQSQEKILRNNVVLGEQLNLEKKNSKNKNEEEQNINENNENELLKINQLNINKNNFYQNEQNIKINPIINKNININLNKEIKPNENINSINDRFPQNVKVSKIGIYKHIHSNSDDYNEELTKKYLNNNTEFENNKLMTINAVKTTEKKDKELPQKQNINDNQNLNISYDSGSNSNYSFKKKLYSPGNNLSKSFVNLSGNNLEDIDDNIKEEKKFEIEKIKKNLGSNKFMTINTIKSAKSQIEKIKSNIYYEYQSKNIKESKDTKENNHQIHPIVTTKKKSSNNNLYNNYAQ